MITARLAVYAAIVCCMWLNGTYAWAKGGSDLNQYAAVAIALTIDAAKCGFLAAAARLWINGLRFPALVLVALWPFALVFSTFSGYASLTTNRAAATQTDQGQAERRARAQTDYDAATAALTLAKQSPFWSASAACTAPKKPQAVFCDGVAKTKRDQSAAAGLLDVTKPVRVDPELTTLGTVTGLPADRLNLAVALWPALLLELVSSLGFYAVHRPVAPKASETPVQRRVRFWHPKSRPIPLNAPAAALGASGAIQITQGKTSAVSSPQPVIAWQIPKAS